MSVTPSLAASGPASATPWPVRNAFDRIAAEYDQDFTDSLIGRLQREAVWRHIDGLFPSGARILDLGCGTGADALHLALRGVQVHAVDVSEGMIAEANRKAAVAGLTQQITTQVSPIEDLDPWNRQSCLSKNQAKAVSPEDNHRSSQRKIRKPGRQKVPQETQEDRQDCLSHYDGAVSNFGALNCVRNLRPVAATLGSFIRPGGHLAIAVITRFCLWETVAYGLQGRFRKATRRWKNGGATTASINGSAQFNIYYRPVSEIVEAFQPEFRLQRRWGIGILVPPSYLEKQASRFPRLTAFGARIDNAVSGWPVCRAAADHALLVFRRE